MVPVHVIKSDIHRVTIGGNTMTDLEFTTRMGDLGFDENSVTATLGKLNVRGRWILSLPPLQKRFLETSGDFNAFAKKSRGFA